jgi:protein-export membrane protein SecD/preprotein translocase SecF subunit
MPKFWTRLVDGLPRESKNLTWRVPLVVGVLILSILIFLPFRDTPYAIRVVQDTFDEKGNMVKKERKYLRHGSPQLGVEEVLDWPGLCGRLKEQGAAKEPSVGKRVWKLLPEDAPAWIEDAAQGRYVRDLPPQLTPQTLLDSARLCEKLSRQGAKEEPSVGKRVWEALPKDIQGKVRDAAIGQKALDKESKAKLVEAFNGLLKKRDLCGEKEARAIALSPKARALLSLDRKSLTDDDVQRLNRLLLGAAFADEIAKSEVELKPRIVDELNERVLANPAFYSEEEFKGIALPAEAAGLLKLDREAMAKEQVERLNRLLLEAAYPQEIARCAESRVTNRGVWLTSFFHYEVERELSAKPLPPDPMGRPRKERTLQVLSRGLSLGLDLLGGTEIVYSLSAPGEGAGGEAKAAESVHADEVKQILHRRIDAYGLKECRIQAQGTDRILVQIPGQEAATLETIKRVIKETGLLEFRLVAGPKSQQVYQNWINSGKIKVPPGYLVYKIVELKKGGVRREDEVLVSNKEEMTGKDISRTRITTGGSGTSLRPAVGLSFSARGERDFARTTGDNVGERLAIILNTQRVGGEIKAPGICYSAPVIRTKILGDAVIEGDFTLDEAKALRTVLMAGHLPVPLELKAENTVGPGLGPALVSKGVAAAIIGTLAVVLFMAAYYLFAGLIADVAVILNILILVAFMILFGGTLTLPGIAGLALTVGMAVDANVLIFERIREETTGATEKPLRLAVRDGFDRAFWTIFDSNLTTILTAVILWDPLDWLGSPGAIKGFGLTLTIGLVINMFTAVFSTRVIFDVLTWRRWITHVPMLQFFRRPNIGFMRLRYKTIVASALVIIAGMTVFVLRGGKNLDIDFRGGTRLHLVFNQMMDAGDIEARLARAGPEFAGCEVQSIAPAARQGGAFVGRRAYEFEVRFPSLSEIQISSFTIHRAAAAGTLDFTVALQAAATPDEVKQKLSAAQVSGYTIQPSGQAKEGGKFIEFKGTAPVADEKIVRADLEKALGAGALASFTPAQAARGYPVQANAQIDRPIPLEDFQRELKARGGDWQIEPVGQEEGKGEYRNFVIRSTVAEENTFRAQIGRAYDSLMLTRSYPAEITRLFKDELAPPDVEVLSQKDGQTTLALNLTSPIALATLEERLAWWRIQAKAKAAADTPPGGLAKRFEITLPDDRRDELTAQVNRDTQTFSPSNPIPRIDKVGPAVAGELLTMAVIAVIASWIAIIAYVWLRFERFKYGAAGVVALVHDVLVTVGMLAILDRKFNLTVIAGILTIIGYSINDTIVVFDRIRENLRKERKRDVDADLVDMSVNQTLSRTVITSFTTLLAVLALFLFAGGVIQDFALTMIIGIVTGTYSSVFIAAPILILGQGQTEKRPERSRAVAATA